MKETALEGEFLSDVFGAALGYAQLSDNHSQWELESQFAVPGGIADAAIGVFGSAQEAQPRVLIELKGPTVDLDRRVKGRTPVQQLWEYLNAVPECPWGILTNYVSFRLYHRNKTQYVYELFTLQGLRDPNEFRAFYALFERDGLLPVAPGRLPRADALLEKTGSRQREVGAQLYKDYHANRVALIDHLRSESHGRSVDEAIHIAQKLLDRIVFVAFCEDRGLLPPKTIERACEQVAPFASVTNPRWQNFRGLFRSIDQGNEKADVTAYNGGLFRLDETVDDLELDDQWTSFFREISSYDFRDEVNVDVLGHLFEQSITDLETLRASPDGDLDPPPRKVSGRRKREGIFYTPADVTRYIVENTIKPCLDERFEVLATKHRIDPHAEPTKASLARWTAYHTECLDVLRRLRVCDPACGSGAFLIQAYDYLEEVREDVITALCMDPKVNEEALRDGLAATILQENLFGVDLSAEAVEITQLALWIRTAQHGKTLADLSRNIQWGNSIVDDPEVHASAVDWQNRFPQVFAEGGFDCIVSNPPYVKLQNFRKREPRVAEFLVKRYRSAGTGNFDLYLPFIERGLELLKDDGRMGLIAPSVWLFNEYGLGLRRLLAERRALDRFVDFKSYQVFPDATTYTALQFFSSKPHERIRVADASKGELTRLKFFDVKYRGLGERAWALLDEREQQILATMRERSTTLEKATAQIFQGLITSADGIYHLTKLGPGRYHSKAEDGEVEIEDEIMKPLVSGKDPVPFATPPPYKYVLFPYRVTPDAYRLMAKDELSEYKKCWAYLRRHEANLRARESGKFDDDQWWRFGRTQNIDKQELPKIGVPQTVARLTAFIDPAGERYFNNVRVNGILERPDGQYSLWFLLGILNSRAADFFFRRIAKPKDRGYFEANKQFIAPLPIPETREQNEVVGLARRLADLHTRRLAVRAGVHRRLLTDLPPSEAALGSPVLRKLPRTLAEFDEPSMRSVLDTMEKFAKRRFRPQERADWDEYIKTETASLAGIKGEIATVESALNRQVYELYGLTGEQIEFIEQEAHALNNDFTGTP